MSEDVQPIVRFVEKKPDDDSETTAEVADVPVNTINIRGVGSQ